MIIEKGTWKVPFENKDENLNFRPEMTNFQQKNRKDWYYLTSRFFYTVDKDTSTENWMFIYEYKNEDEYGKWTKKFKELMESDEGKKAWKN